jgi:DNA-binding NtrC family response regulator
MERDNINLMIVDDEEAFLEATRKRLEARGFNVFCANRGEKALELAKKQPIDIALVDLKMPGISGEETLRALKKEHKWMEVVILTGHGSIDSAVETTRDGAYGYLQKPCELDHLLKVLADAYKKRVMKKMEVEEHRIQEILKKAAGDSPLAILRRLREVEEEGLEKKA